MFHFAYDGYLNYAYPYDELRSSSSHFLTITGYESTNFFHEIFFVSFVSAR